MTDESITDTKLSRRQFMGTAAAGAVALGAVAGAPSFVPKVAASPVAAGAKALDAAGGKEAQSVQVPTNWSKTADIVVVGYGGAGAVTAITAFDMGANVLVLEKSPSLASLGVSPTNPPSVSYTISGGGGNTHTSGGLCIWPSDPVAAANYMYSISWGETPFDVCEAWATLSTGNKAWFDKMGIPYTVTSNAAAFPTLPGASSINRVTAVGSGAVLFQYMDKAVQTRGIPVLFNTPATDLIQNPLTKEILGVRALSNFSEVLNIRANKAVVLCSGGFECNDAMMATFLRLYPCHTIGWQYNTGDGINMAQKVGAGLWHMDGIVSNTNAWFPDYVATWSTSVKNNAYIFVNRYGQRYINESTKSAGYNDNYAYTVTDFNLAEPAYTRIPYFIIFDSTGLKAGALGSTTHSSGITSLPPQVGGGPAWSADNSVELAKGWIIKGATSVADLANAINSANIVSSTWANAHPITYNIDPNVLTATVNQWNADCAAGKGDTVFGRLASAMLPISTPPFYAIAQWPAMYNTQGGPIRNAKAQVCDPDGNPIPRLYSNGECGSIIGLLYPTGGGDISELISFGQIAANNAVAENPWTS